MQHSDEIINFSPDGVKTMEDKRCEKKKKFLVFKAEICMYSVGMMAL